MFKSLGVYQGRVKDEPLGSLFNRVRNNPKGGSSTPYTTELVLVVVVS